MLYVVWSIKGFLSAIVQNKRTPESFLQKVNQKFFFICKNKNFIFINITILLILSIWWRPSLFGIG